MATKNRLQRQGKKGYAYYHVVVADSRKKRDGRYIERLGMYNPNTNPATIDIDFDQTLDWVSKGAEMSDTARAILSYKGVLFKNHLLRGVAKGALTEADVEKKFQAWLKDKEAKIAKEVEGVSSSVQKEEAERLAAERKVSEARAKEIAAKNTPEEVEEEEAPVAEEAPKTEEKKEETPKAEEKKEETPKEESSKTEEKPKAEVKAEKTASPEPGPAKDPVEEKAKEAKAEAKAEVEAEKAKAEKVKADEKKEEPKAEEKKEDKKEDKKETK